MEQASQHKGIAEYFSELEDPRWRNRRHTLLDIVVIAICAVICGVDSWEDIELFGQAKEPRLKGFLELPHGIPSHVTFRRVFAVLVTERFQTRFVE